ncbi:unnamed protein product [Auanema sp. JU1783]|nr:unnamed protein product [Auanema sp. JU1783]
MKTWFLVLLLPSLCLAADDPYKTNDVYVDISLGKLKGFHVNYGNDSYNLFNGEGDVFLGIPFVQPPVGQLRFQKPKAICALPGTAPYDATFYRPMCPQDGVSNSSMSEDCLYLNVFSPSVASDIKKPVMVWIHGGSMRGGTARDFNHKGAISNLVSRGVVVVTIQYRLGLLGFFTTHSDDFPPNLGMLDQVEAIRWVKDNIDKFGGDPHRVTLFGQSAGGASVSAHTLSPLSQHMFQSAIMESGVANTCFEGSLGFTDLSFRRAQAVCNTTRAEWNSNNFTNVKACLMNADYHIWLPYERSYQDAMGWKMSQDDYFMPDIPANLAKKRPNIPVMLGSMLNEWSFFDYYFLASGVPLAYYTRQGFELEFQTFATFLGAEQTHITNIYENVYAPPGISDNDNVAWLQTNDKALTCAGFTGFIGQEANAYLDNKNPNVFLYQMVYPPNVGKPPYTVPGWSPVGHASELPYIWRTENDWNKAIKENIANENDYYLSDWFGESWTNFAKYGFPIRNVNKWPPLESRSDLKYYEINVGNDEMKRNYRKTDQTIWNQVIPALAGPLPPPRPDYNNGTVNFEALRQKYEKSVECVPVTSTTVPLTSTTPVLTSSTTILHNGGAPSTGTTRTVTHSRAINPTTRRTETSTKSSAVFSIVTTVLYGCLLKL